MLGYRSSIDYNMQKNSRKQIVNKEAIERGINCPRGNETFLFLWLISNTRGLHTRACKYNLSALETYFECEGVKPTNLNFT